MSDKVIIRTQQVHSKPVTTVHNLKPGLDLDKIVKSMKASLSCNGHVAKDKNGKNILQLRGDFADDVESFLVSHSCVASKEDVEVPCTLVCCFLSEGLMLMSVV